MPLYEITTDRILALPTTTFAQANIRERTDLQRLLRDQVEIISPDTLVVAEEFGDWEDSRRRIDLLGIDRNANLVVIELKRTEDGGHVELQALRYAAMVSTMTFDQVVEAFTAHLLRLGQAEDPRATILDFLGWDEPDDDQFAKDVSIVLASADFTREITTAVMWLNEHGLDIRCVRLDPYRHGDNVLLDVQQVIPLREAEEYQVRVREKRERERVARQVARSRDLTEFTVTTPEGVQGQLPKRRAIYEVVKTLAEAGVPVTAMQQVIEKAWPRSRTFCSALGEDLDSDSFIAAVKEQSEAAGRAFDPRRFFCDDSELIRSDGSTYAFSNQWSGVETSTCIDALLRAYPDKGISYATDEAAT